jgi:beta-glucosidase
MNRRTLLAAAGTGAAAALHANTAQAQRKSAFPKGFLWGAGTAAYQVEGNNVASDIWLAENVQPTMFTEHSGDADNSFELWPTDLDLVRGLGLNSYRFSLEWARIEPEPGMISIAMLDHYKAMIDGCRARNLTPVVTFNHFTVPCWVAARGGWSNPEAPMLFARFCDRAARHLAPGIGFATTLNEPNTVNLIGQAFPPQFLELLRAMNAAAGRACDASSFQIAMLPDPEMLPAVQKNLLAAHRAGRAAIKAARGDLPVGVSLAMPDDEAVGPDSLRDAMRKAHYGAWIEAVKDDDFLGVQNYDRVRWDNKGIMAPPAGATLNLTGREVYPPSLANAVRYAHTASGLPIMVTEHGIVTGQNDDALRAAFIPHALADLQAVISDGVPVLGYMHWSLLDNFEWVFGYKYHYGLFSVDRTSFARSAKPSAAIYGAIARRNAA